MIISDAAVRNRTTVFFLVLLIIIGGLWAYTSLPLESAPDVQIPNVFVNTYYRGVSPEDMENLITIPIEKKLKGLSGAKEIRSVSSQGLSFINIEFDSDIDIEDALNRVKDKVDLAKVDLPTDLEDDPVVEEVNFSEFPILVLALSGEIGMRDLTELAEDLADDIEGVNGVLEVEVVGKVEREIHIEEDPRRVVHYGVHHRTMPQAVASEHQNVSGGFVRTKGDRYQLRVPSEFEEVRHFEEMVVQSADGSPVYLRDVAQAEDGIKERESRSRMNGKESVTLYVKKRSGENIVEIVDGVEEVLAKAEPSWPPGVEITRVDDRAVEIRNMVSDLENNMISGLILVVLVVWLAMGLRNALLVSLSIPLSMLITFVVLKMLGITLNMVVLFSLTLALGMLVDNAIVIVENIYRFMQQGVPRLEAARRATSEVAWPIVGSGLTTIGAFVPLLAWDGIMGGFMIFLPKTVIITLAACLFVALVVNPALAAVLMRVKRDAGDETDAPSEPLDHEDPSEDGAIVETEVHGAVAEGNPILHAYRELLRAALRHRFATLLVAGTTCVAMMLFWYMRVGVRTPVEFFPSPDPKNVYVSIKMPEGASLDYADTLVREVATRLYHPRAGSADERSGATPRIQYAEALAPYEHVNAKTGEPYNSPTWLPSAPYVYEKASIEMDTSSFGDSGSPNQVGVKFLEMDERTESSKLTMRRIEEAVQGIAGAEILVKEPQPGPPTGAPINIEISGKDFAVLDALAEQVKNAVRKVEFVRNVRDDYEEGSPQIHVLVDRKRAGLLGLRPGEIGFAIRLAFAGIIASTYREGDDDYDILVRFREQDREDLATLRRMILPLPDGRRIPLSTVARVEYRGGLGSITHIDQRRVVTVKADVDESKTTGDTARKQAESYLVGSARFRRDHVLDWDALVQRLATDGRDGGDPAVARIWSLLPARARALVAERADRPTPGSQTEAAREPALDAKRQVEFIADWNQVLANRALLAGPLAESPFAALPLEREVRELIGRTEPPLDAKEVEQVNRALMEASLPGLLGPSDLQPLRLPPGYRYEFTGENEEQKKASEFLQSAMLIACLLILFILVAQFNSVLYPLVILSAVILSLGGVFMGLGIVGLPFGIIMTGVGVISLAGVVVNNAIVLVDYIEQLRERGLGLNEAIISAGTTRLRPVLLTAITTVLGLIPMAVGVSYDFREMRIQWVSESSQWWQSMAVAVMFGLALATLLTLVVVPVLVSLVDGLRRFPAAVAAWWWGIFDAKHGTAYAAPWRAKAALDGDREA